MNATIASMNMESTVLFQETIHPRVFLGPEGLDAMRLRVQRGIGARAFAEILRRCERYTDPTCEEYVDPQADRVTLLNVGQWGCGLNPALHALGFAAAITREKRWLDPCLQILRTVAQGTPVCTGLKWPFNFQYNAPEPICYANLSGHLPLVFDLLSPDLDAETQTLVGAYLRNNIVAPYYHDFLRQRHKYAMGLGMNPVWHELYTWAWSLAAIYDPEHPDDHDAMLLLAELVRRALHLGLDECGTIGEGVGYGRYDAYRWVTCAEILYRAGICDLWKEEPQLTEMMRHWTYLLRPDGGFLNRSDATGNYDEGPLWSMLLHARHTGDPVAQWTYEQYGGREQVESGIVERVDAGCPGFYLLWDRDDALSHSPAEAQWPTNRAGGRYGEHVIRSGWAADDLVASVLAGGRQYGCYIHQHADAGHVSLYALNEAFSVEAGYGDKRAAHHTLLRPGGGDVEGVTDGFDQAWQGGYTTHCASAEHAAYICIDSARMWRSLWNYRHVLTVMAPGTDPYVLILDNVNQANDWERYDWTLNTHADNTIELDNDNWRAAVHGKENRMELAFATFGAGDYPKAHTLSLGSDSIDSISFGKLPDGGERILGQGERPRLVGQLEGYNGVVLAALMPRRKQQPPVCVTRQYGGYQFCLTLDHGDVVDTVVCSPVDRSLDCEGITGEATLAVVRRDRSGKLCWWCACEASSLTENGNTLLKADGGMKVLAAPVDAGV